MLNEYTEARAHYRVATEAFRAALEPFALTPMEAMALLRCDGFNRQELANDLQVTLPQITHVSKELEAQGLIKVRAFKKPDKRIKRMDITHKGVEVLAKIKEL